MVTLTQSICSQTGFCCNLKIIVKQGLHMLKELEIKGIFKKSLKIKSALKNAGKPL